MADIYLPRFGAVTTDRASQIFSDSTTCKSKYHKAISHSPVLSQDNTRLNSLLEPLGMKDNDKISRSEQYTGLSLSGKKGAIRTHKSISLPPNITREAAYRACCHIEKLMNEWAHKDIKWEGEGLNLSLTHRSFPLQNIPDLRVTGSVLDIRSYDHFWCMTNN